MQRRLIHSVLGLTLAAGLFGCGDRTEVAETPPVAPAVEATIDRDREGPAERIVENAVLAGKVKAALVAADGLDAFEIDVDATADNVIVLDGTVPTAALKTLAGATAQKVEGVRAVANRLVVAPAR